MTPNDSRSTLAFVARALARRKLVMACFLALSVAAVVVGTKLAQPTYRSQAKLYVRLGRENSTLDPTATLGQNAVVAVPASRDNELNSAQAMLTSQPLLERVIEKLGPDVLRGVMREPGAASAEMTPQKRYEALRDLSRRLSVEVVKRSSILHVSYEGPNPDAAQAIISQVVETYVEMHGRLSRTPGAYRFLSDQTERTRKELAKTEEELRQLKARTGVVAPEAQRQVLMTRVGRLEDELMQAEAAAADAAAEIQALQARGDRLSATQVTAKLQNAPHPATDNLRAQLSSLQVKEKGLQVRYGANHSEVRKIRREIEEAEARLKGEANARPQVTEGPSRVHEETRLALDRQTSRLEGLRSRAEVLRGQLAEQRKALAELTSHEPEFARLQRRLDREVAQHRKYAENLEQAQIDEEMQAGRLSNVSVAEPATWEPMPVRPSLARNLALAVAFGVCGAVALAMFREASDRTLKSPAEASAALALPALASLPRGCRADSPEAALAGARAWEQIRDGRPKAGVLGVSPGTPADPADQAALVLARAAAESGEGPVLLVNTSGPRRGGRPGLSELLNGKCSLADAVETISPGLCALSPGAALEPALFERLSPLLEELGRQFANVVVLLPPDLPATVRRSLVGVLGGVVLVVRAERNTPESCLAGRQGWVAAGVPVLGVVMDSVRRPPAWLAAFAAGPAVVDVAAPRGGESSCGSQRF